jgi:hypothetical protein
VRLLLLCGACSRCVGLLPSPALAGAAAAGARCLVRHGTLRAVPFFLLAARCSTVSHLVFHGPGPFGRIAPGVCAARRSLGPGVGARRRSCATRARQLLLERDIFGARALQCRLLLERDVFGAQRNDLLCQGLHFVGLGAPLWMRFIRNDLLCQRNDLLCQGLHFVGLGAPLKRM